MEAKIDDGLNRLAGCEMERKQVIATQCKLLQLYFIRHGETAWSLSGQHTGATDIPLTAHGEDEAREIEPCLRGIQFSRVLTSPRQRARRTCELAGLGHSAEIEPDLSEWDYGDYEGKRSVDLRKVRPDWNVFRDGCPGGEAPAQISDRADRLIANLYALEGNVALFSHGQFGCVLAARWIGLAAIEGQHFALGPASLSILSHKPSHPEVRVIALWNDGPHHGGSGRAADTQHEVREHRGQPAPSIGNANLNRFRVCLCTSTRPDADGEANLNPLLHSPLDDGSGLYGRGVPSYRLV